MVNAIADSVIPSAVDYLKGTLIQPPDSAQLVNALLRAEKQSKQNRQRYSYPQLLGSWRLGFVSGTQKVRPRPGATPIKQPGKGRFLPGFVQITITYAADDPQHPATGTVNNRVKLGPASIQLSGPTRFWPKTNSLGFDFVHLRGAIGAWTLYDAPVRGGKESARTFQEKSLKEQAFFTFFIVEKDYIAARGKGGGLALWTRLKD